MIEEKGVSNLMTLQIHFWVSEHQNEAFQRVYDAEYVPALRKQAGYLSSRLLEIFPDELADKIDAAPTNYNYQLELTFDSEDNRRRWAATDEHDRVWNAVTTLAEEVTWQAFYIRGRDDPSN